MWQITITKADNGWVLEYPSDVEGELEPRYLAVEDPPDGNEVKSAQKMLWEVMEYFNLFGSKHDSERLRVIREKDHKEIKD